MIQRRGCLGRGRCLGMTGWGGVSRIVAERDPSRLLGMRAILLRKLLTWVVFCFSAVQAGVSADKPLWIVPGHVGGIGDSAFTTNFYLTVGFDGMVKAWNARTFEFSHTIPVHQMNPARARIAISADEKYMAHSSVRGVYISEIATGRLIVRIPEGLALIAFEPRTNLLVTTAGTRRAYWNFAGQLEREVVLGSAATPPWEEWPNGDEAYSPDKTERATVDGGQLIQSSAATGKQIRVIELPRESTWYSLYGDTVAYSRDGKFLASGALVLDAKTGAVVKQLLRKSQIADVESHVVSTAVAWNATVVSRDDHEISQFDYETGRLIGTFTNERPWYGRLWLSPGADLVMTDTRVQELATGETIWSFSDRIIAVDRMWTVMADLGGTNKCVARLLRYSDGAVLATLLAPERWGATAGAFSSDGTVLATGGGYMPGIMFPWDDAAVRLWSVPGGELLKTLQPTREDAGPAKVVCFSPDGRFVASVANRYKIDVNVWAVESGEQRLTLQLKGEEWYGAEVPAAIGLFGDKPWVAFADMKGIAVWDFLRKKQVFRMDTETQGVTDLKITPDGQRIVIGRGDGTIAMLAVPRYDRFTMPEVDAGIDRVAVDFFGRTNYRFYHSTDLRTWAPIAGFQQTNDTYSAQFPAAEQGYFRAVRIE